MMPSHYLEERSFILGINAWLPFHLEITFTVVAVSHNQCTYPFGCTGLTSVVTRQGIHSVRWPRTKKNLKSVFLIEVLSFGLGVAELVLVLLLAVLLVSGLSFVHTVIYDANKQAHNQDTEIKDLSLSSNRRHIKYGVKFSSGFLMAWPKLS